jgi:hypothetical protein
MQLRSRSAASTIGVFVGAVLSGCLLSVPAKATIAACGASSGSPTCNAPSESTTSPYLSNGTIDSFSGLFSGDSNIQVFAVNVGAGMGVLTAATFSYGGGHDLTGASVTVPTPGDGGFATQIAVFDSGGNFMGNTGTSNCPSFGQQNNGATGECFDNALSLGVAPGTYYVALTESGISGGNLSNGNNLFTTVPSAINLAAFNQGSGGNFTASYSCGQAAFCDVFGDPMDGTYDLDIGVGTPEPGSFGLVALALGVGVFLTWRRRKLQA